MKSQNSVTLLKSYMSKHLNLIFNQQLNTYVSSSLNLDVTDSSEE